MEKNFIESNYVQLEILKELLFQKECTFSKLDKQAFGSNLLTYHLKKLIEQEYVIKNQNGTYSLTNHGKEFASMIDTWSKKAVIHKQGKLRAACVIFQGKIGESDIVVSKRLKEPFYGFYGLPVEKVQFGETPLDAMNRCIQRETGLLVTPSLRGTMHKLLFKNEKLVEDSYFFMFMGSNAKGNLINEGPGFSNQWLNINEFNKLSPIYNGTINGITKTIESKELFWYEDRYDLEIF